MHERNSHPSPAERDPGERGSARPPASWTKDPVVWFGAFFAALTTIGVLFAGRYLPYTDWSNHVGLIAVFADGEATGALDYLVHSLAPTPYLSFYALAALLGQWVPVDVAAKIVLSTASPLFVLGAASLAEATGRSPRAALIAPLAAFGVSLGFGFASFVFTSPILLFALSSAERLLADLGEPRRRRATALAVWLALLFLGHGILYLTALALIAVRVLGAGFGIVTRRRFDLRQTFLRSVGWILAGAIPSLLLAAPTALRELVDPWREAGTSAGASRLFELSSFEERISAWRGHLLERGHPDHNLVMVGVAVWFGVLLAWSLARTHPRRPPVPALGNGLEIFAGCSSLLYLFGPITVGPVWYIYPRFGVLAALLVCLLPRAHLGGRMGSMLALSALLLVGWNATLNARGIATFSSWAASYDGVRAAIPRRARVLPLTVVGEDDFTQHHPALNSLYFYHLVDGASYVPFLFDNRLHPVRFRRDVQRPRAPFWRSPSSYDPHTHGRDFDYLVLRGADLVRKTEGAGEHDRVADIHGWVVFKTRNPTPRP